MLIHIIHDASTASAATTGGLAAQPFDLPHGMPQRFTSPSARLAARLHAFVTTVMGYAG